MVFFGVLGMIVEIKVGDFVIDEIVYLVEMVKGVESFSMM